MGEDTRGPSWYDVSVYAEYLQEKWGVRSMFRLARPIRRVDGRGYTSWIGSVELYSSGADGGFLKGFNAAWGKGGAAATAPGALYEALTRAEGWLEERDEAARSQAAF